MLNFLKRIFFTVKNSNIFNSFGAVLHANELKIKTTKIGDTPDCRASYEPVEYLRQIFVVEEKYEKLEIQKWRQLLHHPHRTHTQSLTDCFR